MTNSSTWMFYLVVEYGMEFIKQELQLCSLLFNLMPQDNKLERERMDCKGCVHPAGEHRPCTHSLCKCAQTIYFIVELYFLRNFL